VAVANVKLNARKSWSRLLTGNLTTDDYRQPGRELRVERRCDATLRLVGHEVKFS